MWKDGRFLHDWLYEEDECACELFRDYYVKSGNKGVGAFYLYRKFLHKLKEEKKIETNITPLSFYRKLQNTSYLCVENGFFHILDAPIHPLNHFSEQNVKAFSKVFKGVPKKVKVAQTIENVTLTPGVVKKVAAPVVAKPIINNQNVIITLLLCEDENFETLKVYISDIEKNVEGVQRISTGTEVAKALEGKKIGDIFKCGETEYLFIDTQSLV